MGTMLGERGSRADPAPDPGMILAAVHEANEKARTTETPATADGGNGFDRIVPDGPAKPKERARDR